MQRYFAYVLIDPGAEVPGLAGEARSAGITLLEPAALPSSVAVVKGLWPGVRLSREGGDRSLAGPTGEPWVDSNGWRVLAARAARPDAQIWIDARPQPSRSSTEDYILAFADAAAHGGNWIVALDDGLAAGLAAKTQREMDIWKQVTGRRRILRRKPGLRSQCSRHRSTRHLLRLAECI